MKIGYLHLDRSAAKESKESGVTRYGRLIAASARCHPQIEVIETEVLLTDDWQRNRQFLQAATQQLAKADIIHFQYNIYTWGDGWSGFRNLRLFVGACRQPLVATLHDLYPEIYPTYGWPAAVWQAFQEDRQRYQLFIAKTLLRSLSLVWERYLANRTTLSWLSKQVQNVLVCTQEEARRISHLVNPQKLNVVPHFVEPRSVSLSPAAARAKLNLAGKVVMLQGFIYNKKGHDLLLESLRHLPPTISAVFAGGPAPAQMKLFRELQARAADWQLEDRLRITGYLSEEELEAYLLAAHLAVCPFKEFSASSSIATWISLGRPILASDLPQIAEYNQLVPGAIAIFSPYRPEALAAAILEKLAVCQDIDANVVRLRDCLSLETVFDRHLECYQRAIQG